MLVLLKPLALNDVVDNLVMKSIISKLHIFFLLMYIHQLFLLFRFELCTSYYIFFLHCFSSSLQPISSTPWSDYSFRHYLSLTANTSALGVSTHTQGGY